MCGIRAQKPTERKSSLCNRTSDMPPSLNRRLSTHTQTDTHTHSASHSLSLSLASLLLCGRCWCCSTFSPHLRPTATNACMCVAFFFFAPLLFHSTHNTLYHSIHTCTTHSASVYSWYRRLSIHTCIYRHECASETFCVHVYRNCQFTTVIRPHFVWCSFFYVFVFIQLS